MHCERTYQLIQKNLFFMLSGLGKKDVSRMMPGATVGPAHGIGKSLTAREEHVR